MTYQKFKEAVISYAVEQKIADYELYYTESESTSVETFKEEVNQYSTEVSSGLCFRCLVDCKEGYASTENLTEEEAKAIVLRAVENAKSIESEEQSFIHKKGDTYAKLEEGTLIMPTGAQLMDAALQLQKEMYACDERVADGTQVYMVCGGEKYALCNSGGLDLLDEVKVIRCMNYAIVKDGDEMFNGSKDKHGNLQEMDFEAMAKEAVEEAISTIGAGSVESGKYTIVFSNKMMAALLATFSSVFSAENAQKGMSLLAGKEGERIAADIITIVDDPRYRDSMVKRTFDGEGVATYAKNVVENGKLTTLLHNLKTAANAGVKSTGNASKASYAAVVGVSPHTFYIQPMEGTKEDLFALAGDGIYVTELAGLHAGANAITGEFSLAATGFLVEQGKKGAPVKNFTVSGNFFELLKSIEKLGGDLEFQHGKFGSPSVLVRDIAVAGK